MVGFLTLKKKKKVVRLTYSILHNLIKTTAYTILAAASLLVSGIILYLVLHAWRLEQYNQYISSLFKLSVVSRKQWRADTARITFIAGFFFFLQIYNF
jgi:hypothetical protein